MDTLPDGDSIEIIFSSRERAKSWDIRVEDDEGNAIPWEKLNLLEISKVTLRQNMSKAWADVE